MNSRKWMIGCGLTGSLLVFVLVIGVIVASFLIPEASAQVPANRNPFYVNINMPLNGGILPLKQTASVYVEAFGDQPLQGIELLVDGVPQPNGSASPAGGKKMIVSWKWTPGKAGIHTLLARASAQSTRTVISRAVNVNVLPPDQMPLPLVQGGITEALVINDETGLTELGAVPVGGNPIPPPPGFNDQGGSVNSPPPFPEEPPSQQAPAEPAQQPGGSFIPIKYLLWGQNMFQYLVEIIPPAAPVLDGGANQCDGILVIQDNSSDEIGFFLYRLSPGQVAFERAATLDGKTGKAAFSYHDPGLAAGQYWYYLSSFNSAGESASNIISITISAAQCAVANPPEFGLFGKSIPIDLNQPVEKAYCYGSANGMPWVRLPHGQDNFIYPLNNKIDLAPYWDIIPLPQPPPPDVTLTMECWGWSGSALIYQGSFSQTFSGGGSPNPPEDPPPGPPDKNEKPQKNLLASPYNVHFSNDPNECQDHVPYNDLNAVNQCKFYMAAPENASHFLLMWTYNRFGDCNPQAETCDTELQPADDFHIYTVKEGKTEQYINSLGFGYTYIAAYDNSKNIEYFVRAVSHQLNSDPIGYESTDSKHALFPQPLETTSAPTSLVTSVWTDVYDQQTASWSNSAFPNVDLYSGYAFGCLFECSQGHFWDSWYYGVAKFDIPDSDIINARLNWQTFSYTTSGPGAQDVIWSCSVKLVSRTDTDEMTLNNFSLYGAKNYDVSLPMQQAKLNGQKSIEFLFYAPDNKAGPVRWNRCLWFIKNISLTVTHYQ